ncbi:hypothetical protein X798_02591 [Onchocerca flexuosa]|uniref:MI domain-containing protein n=1 Tax=Onchocerca flexuosa TaxID=387005 RepID=A0A238BYV8_9BILA|nr:hypothetical protein X798_02591 [Onchocerca flexuosa]
MNKACTRNLPNITRDLLRENVIQERGLLERGLLARSIIQAQSYSPIFSKIWTLQHYCKFVCSVKKNERLYGLLAERFCRLGKEFQEAFERIARDTYNTIHRFEYNKLRNMACLVAHLLSTDAVSRDILDQILLNEDISSSGRMYIKII